MGDVLVMAGDGVGVDGVDYVVDVVRLHCHRGKPVQHLLHPAPDIAVQQGNLDIFLFFKIVDGRAIAYNAGSIHRHRAGKPLKGGQGTAGGNGESASVSHACSPGIHHQHRGLHSLLR